MFSKFDSTSKIYYCYYHHCPSHTKFESYFRYGKFQLTTQLWCVCVPTVVGNYDKQTTRLPSTQPKAINIGILVFESWSILHKNSNRNWLKTTTMKSNCKQCMNINLNRRLGGKSAKNCICNPFSSASSLNRYRPINNIQFNCKISNPNWIISHRVAKSAHRYTWMTRERLGGTNSWSENSKVFHCAWSAICVCVCMFLQHLLFAL